MRGSFLATFLDYDPYGLDWMDIFNNGILKKRINISSNNLYSIPIELGDEITVTFGNPEPEIITQFTLTRIDYTTDDVAGNNGIFETTIIDGVPFTTYTFTVSTISDAYGYEYRFINDVITQFQLWTEASEPILTENNDYINQQY